MIEHRKTILVFASLALLSTVPHLMHTDEPTMTCEKIEIPPCDNCTTGGPVQYQARAESPNAIFAYQNGWYCREVHGECLD